MNCLIDRKKAGRLFITDGAAWPKARLAISVLTGNCFKKCLSDDRDTFGINSTTADFRYAGYLVSRTLYANVATFVFYPINDWEPVEAVRESV